MASLAALAVAAFAPPTRAQTAINFNPAGNGAGGPVINTSSFVWAPGNAVSINGAQLSLGQTITLEYQALMGGITPTATSANIASFGGANEAVATAPAATGTPLTPTGNQFIITAQFTEVVTQAPNAGNGFQAQFAFVSSAPDSVNIYAQSAFTGTPASLNNSTGAGYPNTGGTPTSTLILSGQVIPQNFQSTFTANLAAGQTDLNGHTAGSNSYTGTTKLSGGTETGTSVSGSNVVNFGAGNVGTLAEGETISGPGIPAGTTITSVNYTTGAVTISQNADGGAGTGAFTVGATPSIQGTGNDQLLVQVDPTKTNTNYFITPPTVISLFFTQITSGVPFSGVDPLVKMFTGYVPQVGTTNGGQAPGNGPDFLFQVLANNSFDQPIGVPEPGTISMALTGIGLSGLAALRRYRRRTKPLAG
jgi:hypothetical protein